MKRMKRITIKRNRYYAIIAIFLYNSMSTARIEILIGPKCPFNYKRVKTIDLKLTQYPMKL
jgi:hypothetical protein